MGSSGTGVWGARNRRVSISLKSHVEVPWLHISPGPTLLHSAGGGEGYRIFRKNTDRPASIGEESPG